MKKLLVFVCLSSVVGGVVSIVWAFRDHGNDAANASAIYNGFSAANAFSGVFAVTAALIAVLAVRGAKPKHSG